VVVAQQVDPRRTDRLDDRLQVADVRVEPEVAGPAVVNLWGLDRDYADSVVAYINTLIAGVSDRSRSYRVSAVAIPERNLIMIRSVLLARVLQHYGFTAQTKLQVPEVVWRGSEACVKGYLRALFQCDGTVQRDDRNAYCTIRLASSEPSLLKDVQTLLANFGIFCLILKRREAGRRLLPDGKGGRRLYDCKAV
jgi:ribonucleoside-diphosphate reductase alpha chain